MNCIKSPPWLDKTAAAYFQKDKARIKADHLELFAVYCQCLSDYRKALAEGDTRQKKIMLDHILKYSKELELTPKAKKPVEERPDDELDLFLQAEGHDTN